MCVNGDLNKIDSGLSGYKSKKSKDLMALRKGHTLELIDLRKNDSRCKCKEKGDYISERNKGTW